MKKVFILTWDAFLRKHFVETVESKSLILYYLFFYLKLIFIVFIFLLKNTWQIPKYIRRLKNTNNIQQSCPKMVKCVFYDVWAWKLLFYLWFFIVFYILFFYGDFSYNFLYIFIANLCYFKDIFFQNPCINYHKIEFYVLLYITYFLYFSEFNIAFSDLYNIYVKTCKFFNKINNLNFYAWFCLNLS